MNDYLKILFYAIVSGAIVAISTYIIEKIGGFMGGILATLPINAIPNTIGIAFQVDDPEKFRKIMLSATMGYFVSSSLLLFWLILPNLIPSKYNFWSKLISLITCSVGYWIIMAILSYYLIKILEKIMSLLIPALVCFFIILLCGIYICYTSVYIKPVPKEISVWIILQRGLAACAVSYIILLSTILLDNTSSGIISAFPTIILMSMIILWISQGNTLHINTIGSMLLGNSGLILYCIILGYIMYLFNFALSELISLIGASMISIPSFIWLKYKSTEQYEPINDQL